SRMLHPGHAALTICRSSEISPAQPRFAAGSEPVLPFWFTFLKHPFAVVHGGNPNCERYTARSDSARGSSCAATTATVRPARPAPRENQERAQTHATDHDVAFREPAPSKVAATQSEIGARGILESGVTLPLRAPKVRRRAAAPAHMSTRVFWAEVRQGGMRPG